MCGIGGLYAYRGRVEVEDQDRLDRLSAAMHRRGPDAQGSWSSPDGLVRLAHRRLAIIDLSPAGNQPMHDSESGCVLVFNGEIYNFRALRRELIGAGHRFFSDSDSEVVLRGYLQWGEEVLPRLRGMFAFALWNPARRGLWLARDPYGIKPLYYADADGRFAFASQVKALRAGFSLDSRPEPAAVVGLLLTGTVPEPDTLFRGARALPAGHAVWVSDQGVGAPSCHASVSEVWRAAAERPVPLDAEALQECVRGAVMDSVAAHQVADVPVGAFLSAGIDSGALLGLMAEGRSAPLQTVTLGFSRFQGTGMDETVYAKQLAARYGARHKTV